MVDSGVAVAPITPDLDGVAPLPNWNYWLTCIKRKRRYQVRYLNNNKNDYLSSVYEELFQERQQTSQPKAIYNERNDQRTVHRTA